MTAPVRSGRGRDRCRPAIGGRGTGGIITARRAFCLLRQHRAAATRHGKRGDIWRGTVDVASHPDLAPPPAI